MLLFTWPYNFEVCHRTPLTTEAASSAPQQIAAQHQGMSVRSRTWRVMPYPIRLKLSLQNWIRFDAIKIVVGTHYALRRCMPTTLIRLYEFLKNSRCSRLAPAAFCR